MSVPIVAGSAAAYGIAAGWLTPRGPVTSTQALTAMATSLVVGLLAGFSMRSKWTVLVAPLVFAVAFELVRIGTVGPTVDRFHMSAYGLIALIVGRGFHGLVALMPMIFGFPAGRAASLRLGGSPPSRHRFARRGLAMLVSVALVGLALLIARPAATDPILGPDGQTLPGSIAELVEVEINGHELTMMIRGNRADSPALLFLAGGPGGSELGAMRNHLEVLEENFVVVTWDQRGSGKSYPALDPTSTLTLDSAVADTISVANYLRDRFDQEKLYVVGQSWGSILGVLAVQERPELFRAFIGTGQMVSPMATDRIFYEDTLDWAAGSGNDDLVRTLTEIGSPPYESILDYEPALSYEHEVYPYDHSQNSEGEGGFSENLLAREYSLVDQVHALGAFLDTFTVLYPQIQHIDFRRQATSLELPVYFVQGANEAQGRSALFEEWFELLDAPSKELVFLNTSGHRPLFEQPEQFADLMLNVVLAETQSAEEPGDR